jgi:hypothetical protein
MWVGVILAFCQIDFYVDSKNSLKESVSAPGFRAMLDAAESFRARRVTLSKVPSVAFC